MLTQQALAHASFISLQQVLCHFLLLEPLGHSASPPRPLCGALLVLPPPFYPVGWHQVTPPHPQLPARRSRRGHGAGRPKRLRKAMLRANPRARLPF